MADLRRTLGSFVTPAGRLVAPCYLNEPDGKFDDSPSRHKYKATVLLAGEDAETFLAQVTEAWEGWLDSVKAATGRKPKTIKKNVQWYTPDTPRWDDIGASTEKVLNDLQEGDAIFKTSMKAVMPGRDGAPDQPRTPKLFDAQGALITNPPPIGFGSVAKISGTFYGWTNAGVANMSLIMQAAQIIELREPGTGGDSDDATDFGFAPVAGGFEHTSNETFGDVTGGDF